jgi:hypothetical protein
MQPYTLIVQNATSREDLGIAMSITHLTRSMGATFGTAIFGAIMASRMKTEVAKQLSGGSGVESLLEPGALGQLPSTVATGIREGLATAMHSVFIAGLLIVAVALAVCSFIKELSLRDTAFADEDAGKQGFDEPNQSAASGVYGFDHRDERQNHEYEP